MSKKRGIIPFNKLEETVKLHLKHKSPDCDVYTVKNNQKFITPTLTCTLSDSNPFHEIEERVVQLLPTTDEVNNLLEKKLLSICNNAIDDISKNSVDSYTQRELQLLKVTARGCGTTIEDSEYIAWYVSLSKKLQIWNSENNHKLNNINLTNTPVRAIINLKQIVLTDYDGPLFLFEITHLEIVEPEEEDEEEGPDVEETEEKNKQFHLLLEQQRKLAEQINAFTK